MMTKEEKTAVMKTFKATEYAQLWTVRILTAENKTGRLWAAMVAVKELDKALAQAKAVLETLENR